MNNSKYQLPKHGGLVKDFAPKDIIHRYERMATRVFESEYHGVQYVDWQFEGEDIVAVIRTAWDDQEGNAHNQHDSNYILFRRVERFAENTTLK